MRKVVAAFVLVSLIGTVSGVTEVALHGFAFFVFRANGAGASVTGPTEDQGPGQPDAPGAHHPGIKPSTKSGIFGRVYQEQSIALFLLRHPAFIPLIFIVRGWLSLNAKEVLTNTEADVLGPAARSVSSWRCRLPH